MNKETRRSIHCPTCGKKTVWAQSNPWRPFCCERCRLLDLGAWASAEHRIPGEKTNSTPSSDPGEEY